MSAPTLYQPRPVLSSQRFSHSPDYVDPSRRDSYAAAGSRLPLRESTGNVIGYGINNLANCYPTPAMLSPSTIPPSIQAPIVPSQSFDCLYRLQAPRQQQPPSYQRRPRRLNPLYLWPAFRQYRHRQAHKDTQKDKGGVWRRSELEDAFVDSVLLMPHMGRRKFSMGGKLHGRNMLISEYIFVICVALLGSKEIFRIDNSNDSIEQMGRKQVSSHMQVVKKFFEDLRCFHFLFPSEDKKEPGSTNCDDYYDDEEQESFKSNPVLTALAEGRVPDVRPNYEYFSQLLDLQSSICIRPKTCEVFVSSSNITLRDEVAYDINDRALDAGAFPHLNKYKNPDESPNVLGRDVLLHEYTRSLDRTTSACAKSVTRRWQKEAPAMYDTLDLPERDEDCLLIEMCSTIELHEHAKFPSGSELTGFVEVAVTPSQLQGHRWKCVTRLTRPAELHPEDSEQTVYTNESGIHRRGCNDSKPDCECHLRPRSDIHVPFPAVEWASILSMAVEYPDVEHQKKKDRHNPHRSHADLDGRPDLERRGSKRKRSEDDGDTASWSKRELTGSDLICKVAMYQELWSCAPDSGRWVRQAIIFWRFQTTNQWYKYKPVFKPAGTSWRWLTINDPMSRYHQQKALVSPAAHVGRDAVMSPTPSVQQHQVAARSENFSSAWETTSSNASSNAQHGGGHVGIPHLSNLPSSNSAMSMFESFSHGLATPPPSASLQGSYPTNSFDPTNMGQSHNGMSFMSGDCNTSASDTTQSGGLPPSQTYFEGQSTSFADVKPVTGTPLNPYLSVSTSLDLSNQLVYDNNAACHNNSNLQSWDMSPIEPWGPGGHNGTNSAGQHHSQSHSHKGSVPSWSQGSMPHKLSNAGSDGSDLWSAAAAAATTGGQHPQAPTGWSLMPAPSPSTHPAGPVGADDRDDMRNIKRRRTDALEQVPVTVGW